MTTTLIMWRLRELLEQTTRISVNGRYPGWMKWHKPVEIDCCFVTVGVLEEKAAALKKEFWSVVENIFGRDFLETGPTYLKIAERFQELESGTITSESDAFRLMALCEALGIASVLTPHHFGFEVDKLELARGGLLKLSQPG